MFDNSYLESFKPDMIYIHTSNRNINNWPEINMTREEVVNLLNIELDKFKTMWDKISTKYSCPIIQNNFEKPFYRLFGNKDASDYRGRVNFVSRLNTEFYCYAEEHENFYINDIDYQSADIGLKNWSDPFYWYMYKMSLNLEAVPFLAFNVANIIKSIYGKNKKALALDLDNTLWGGVVGDDGVENLKLGQDESEGQAYIEFQEYLSALNKQGILLNIISKNDYENAISGLNHPQMLLKKEDFISIKANWDPKGLNLKEMASEMNILPESFVYVDDNPAERANVKLEIPGISCPEIEKVQHYIYNIDRAGYFEVTSISTDDLKRHTMYKQNLQRSELLNKSGTYEMYLKSLEMTAEVKDFTPVYLSRIAQLTNKTNQFNLTTQRFSREEIERIALDDSMVSLYGILRDCFGDNGIVTVVVGKINNDVLDIILWLMSCRVLKRGMENVMMDELIARAKTRGIHRIIGNYYPTLKNSMVKDFYSEMGFTKISEDDKGNTKWEFDNIDNYINTNTIIKV